MFKKGTPVHGVGVNDADFVTCWRDKNGKWYQHPIYGRWKNMLQRCYDPKFHDIQPTYAGCSVAPEWHYFSEFCAWAETRYKPSYQLDKDIIVPGNKVYGPLVCLFVPREINMLLADCSAARGEWPQGVYLSKRNRKFQAALSVRGKMKHLGYFTTPEAAAACYNKAKAEHIRSIAQQQNDEQLEKALLRHAMLFSERAEWYEKFAQKAVDPGYQISLCESAQ